MASLSRQLDCESKRTLVCLMQTSKTCCHHLCSTKGELPRVCVCGVCVYLTAVCGRSEARVYTGARVAEMAIWFPRTTDQTLGGKGMFSHGVLFCSSTLREPRGPEAVLRVRVRTGLPPKASCSQLRSALTFQETSVGSSDGLPYSPRGCLLGSEC